MSNKSTKSPEYFLDITDDVCPMTFVRTRLLIEKMPVGARAEILLKGDEPRRNVPDSLTELGHVVEVLERGSDDVFRLVVLKS